MEKKGQPTSINFAQVYRDEKAKASEKVSLKSCTIPTCYNLLQDMRHLILLDFRGEAERRACGYIRKSMEADVAQYQKMIFIMLCNQEQKQQFKSHYEGDDFKRVLFIFPKAGWQQLEKQIGAELEEFNQALVKSAGERIGKAFYLKNFEEFQQKYPFLCIKDDSSDKAKMIALSRFPSQIKDNLYMGNMMNVMDKREVQLNLLGIKKIIYLTPGKFEPLEERFNCVHYEIQEFEHPEVDIEGISDMIINDLKTKENVPILVFCINGLVSGAICTRVMLKTNSAWPKEMALAYVMNKRYEMKDMPAWLFSQINVGKVTKTKSEPIQEEFNN